MNGDIVMGMRRAEIGQRLGLELAPAVFIQEPVRHWWTHDAERCRSLVKELGKVDY